MKEENNPNEENPGNEIKDVRMNKNNELKANQAYLEYSLFSGSHAPATGMKLNVSHAPRIQK